MPAALPQSLAIRHLWLTFWGGLALTPPLCLGAALLFYANSRAHSTQQLLTDIATLTGGMWLFATLPALFFCWLRLGAMRWIFGCYLTQLPTARVAQVVLGTLVLFEAGVLASTLALYLVWRTAIEWVAIWRICTGCSLPWLVAALWASWQVLRRPVASGLCSASQAG